MIPMPTGSMLASVCSMRDGIVLIADPFGRRVFEVQVSPPRIMKTVRFPFEPALIAPVEGTPFAYITGNDSAYLTELDTSEGRVTWQMTIGKALGGVALSHDKVHAYVSDIKSNTLYALNLSSHKMENPITLSAGSWRPYLNKEESKIYVATARGSEYDRRSGAIDVVSLATRKLVKTIEVDAQGVCGLAISPDNRKLYAVTNYPGRLFSIDMVKDELDAQHEGGLEIGAKGYDIVLDNKNPWAYVGMMTAQGLDRTLVVDLEKFTIIGYITDRGGGIMSMQETKDGHRLLFITGDEYDKKESYGSLTVVDLDKLEKRIKEEQKNSQKKQGK